MQIYFSPSALGFFVDSVHGENKPEDAIKITLDLYNEIMDGQSKGLGVSADALGMPVLVNSSETAPVTEISRAQGKAALIQSGHWNSVLAYIESIEDATEKALAEVAIHDTTTWKRDSPFLTKAAKAVGLSDRQVDALFVEASKIKL